MPNPKNISPRSIGAAVEVGKAVIHQGVAGARRRLSLGGSSSNNSQDDKKLEGANESEQDLRKQAIENDRRKGSGEDKMEEQEEAVSTPNSGAGPGHARNDSFSSNDEGSAQNSPAEKEILSSTAKMQGGWQKDTESESKENHSGSKQKEHKGEEQEEQAQTEGSTSESNSSGQQRQEGSSSWGNIKEGIKLAGAVGGVAGGGVSLLHFFEKKRTEVEQENAKKEKAIEDAKGEYRENEKSYKEHMIKISDIDVEIEAEEGKSFLNRNHRHLQALHRQRKLISGLADESERSMRAIESQLYEKGVTVVSDRAYDPTMEAGEPSVNLQK